MDKFQCNACKQIREYVGIEIINHSISKFPKEIKICKECIDRLLLSALQGKLNIGNIAKGIFSLKG